MQAKHFRYVVLHLLDYALPSTPKDFFYGALVDIANVYQMSIAELIQFVGFRYVNQFDIYKAIGYFLYDLGNGTFWAVNPFQEEENQYVGVKELKIVYDRANRR